MSLTKGSDKLIRGIHLPSFGLGFVACAVVYHILPGFQSVIDELVKFIKYTVVLAVIIGCCYGFYLSQQSRNIEENSPGGTFQQDSKITAGNESEAKSRIVDVNQRKEFRDGPEGGYRYFKIPVTKLENTGVLGTSDKLNKHRESLIQDKMKGEKPGVYVEKRDWTKDLGRSINLTEFGKTEQVNLRRMRYENFVNMANHRG